MNRPSYIRVNATEGNKTGKHSVLN